MAHVSTASKRNLRREMVGVELQTKRLTGTRELGGQGTFVKTAQKRAAPGTHVSFARNIWM